jgi:hypothetical protein
MGLKGYGTGAYTGKSGQHDLSGWPVEHRFFALAG